MVLTFLIEEQTGRLTVVCSVRYLHHIHHKYNKEHTLSPFAGLAFHPLDGCLQAAPYVAALFIVPAHALTFELLLFATGVWTTNIHDCIDGKVCLDVRQSKICGRTLETRCVRLVTDTDFSMNAASVVFGRLLIVQLKAEDNADFHMGVALRNGANVYLPGVWPAADRFAPESWHQAVA